MKQRPGTTSANSSLHWAGPMKLNRPCAKRWLWIAPTLEQAQRLRKLALEANSSTRPAKCWSLSAQQVPHVLVALAAIACKQGRILDAETLVNQAIAVAPRHVLARLTSARIAGRSRLSESSAYANSRLPTPSHPQFPKCSARIHAMRMRDEADALMEKRHVKSALAILVAALKHDPEDPLIHLRLVKALEHFGEAQRAEESRARAC